MDQLSTDQNDRDFFAYCTAWGAMIIAAIVIIVHPTDTTKSEAKKEHAYLVEKTGESHITSLATSLGGVFAGTASGPTFAITRAADGALTAAKKDEPGSVTALLVAEQGLWKAFGAAPGQPASLEVTVDPHGAAPSKFSFTLPELGTDGQITALANGLGRVWIGTTKGLFSYDFGRRVSHSPPSRFSPGTIRSVRCLYVDLNGTLWVGTDTGLFSYNGTEGFPVAGVDGLPAEPVLALTGDNRGGLVCGTAAGLWTSDRGVWIRQAQISEPVLAVLAVGADVWVGTKGGMFRKEEGMWLNVSAQLGLPPGAITCMAYGGDRIYVGASDGLRYVSFAIPTVAAAKPAPSGPVH